MNLWRISDGTRVLQFTELSTTLEIGTISATDRSFSLECWERIQCSHYLRAKQPLALDHCPANNLAHVSGQQVVSLSLLWHPDREGGIHIRIDEVCGWTSNSCWQVTEANTYTLQIFSFYICQ